MQMYPNPLYFGTFCYRIFHKEMIYKSKREYFCLYVGCSPNINILKYVHINIFSYISIKIYLYVRIYIFIYIVSHTPTTPLRYIRCLLFLIINNLQTKGIGYPFRYMVIDSVYDHVQELIAYPCIPIRHSGTQRLH